MWVRTFSIFFLRWDCHLLHYQNPAKSRIGLPVNDGFQSCQNPINFKSGHSCSFQIYQTPGRRYASRQLLELTNVAFRDTKTLSAVGADVPFALRFRASKILSTLRADILVAFRATKHLEDAMLPVNCLN